MDKLKTIIDMLGKIRANNEDIFNTCVEEKLLRDAEYEKLYRAFWKADFRLKNVISLLDAVEKDLNSEIKG